jgi:PAS domain S-box-containing protein
MEPLNYRERRLPAGSLAAANRQLLIDIDDVHTVAQGIVDTIRDPLLVLDQHLCVVSANRSFCQTFRMSRQNIEDRPVYALGDGQWNIPALRFLLENIATQHTVMEGYEVEREFPGIGRRSMLLSAREVVSQRNARKLILMTIEDVTERRAAEREMAELLRHKEMLLQEMQHRIANTLQIIASILLLKARTAQSEETRMHLGMRICDSCQWGRFNNSCWPRATAIRSTSALISLDCPRPWQPRWRTAVVPSY